MNNCNQGCKPPIPNGNQLLLEQILKELKELKENTRQALLNQDQEIAQICQNLKINLANSIRTLLDSMQNSGELDDIITSTILEDINNLQTEINNDNIWYGKEIYTKSQYDQTSETNYYLTYIPMKTRKGEDLRLEVGMAGDDYTGSTLESTIDFAHRKNATVCINAGFFSMDEHIPRGAVIRNGQVVFKPSGVAERYNYACFNKYGWLEFRPNDYSPERMLLEGICQAVCGTVILIQNNNSGAVPDNDRHPRQAIGQRIDGSIVILTCDGRDIDNNGMTYADLQRIFHDEGCINAINLDGGGSTATILRGIKQNETIDMYGTIDREVSNFFYLSKPTTFDVNQIVAECYEAVGLLKEELIKMIVNSNNVEKGYIRLLAKEGFLYPGIEFYPNGARRSIGKIGYNDTYQRFFISKYDEDNDNYPSVFQADENGIYINGGSRLAWLFDYPKRVPNNNCNVTGVAMTLYYCYRTDDNAPTGENCLILHIPFTSDLSKNIRQIKLPLNNRESIKVRSCDASGNWTDWEDYGQQRGTTANRPSDRMIGAQYYDTTLKMPLWWDGSKWLDAAGNEV